MQKRLERREVPEELTWNLADIFPDQSVWEEELESVEDILKEVTSYRGRLHESGDTLLSCLKTREELHKKLARVSSYALLQWASDGTSDQYQANDDRGEDLKSRVESETSFIKAEILRLSRDDVERFVQEAPELASFGRFIDQIQKKKPYALSDDTEETLAALSGVLNAPVNIYERSKNSDFSFEPVRDGQGQELPMSFSLYQGKYESSPDLVLRRNAFASFTRGLKALQNTHGAIFGTEIKKNVTLARLRGYPSYIDMELARQEVTRPVYDNLHDILLGELAPAMRRFARLRKRVLGLDQLYHCDLGTPLDPDYVAPKTDFEEACKHLIKGLGVMGDEYAALVQHALENRWVDRADNIGKATGAFCEHIPGVHPYILMTWADSIGSTLTLAHELGHAVHAILSERHQRLTNTDTSMFFVEAPSGINSLLMSQYFLNQATDKRMRRWVITQLVMTYYGTFANRLMAGELQRRIYALAEAGNPITASVLNRTKGEIMEDYWQGEVIVDEGARLNWMRLVHYYVGLSPFGYSAGLTVGTGVVKAIQETGQEAVDRWLEVLKAGGSKPPLELAAMAGVDLENPESFRDAVKFVTSLIDELEESF